MQNTIVKEYDGDPEVVTFILDEGGRFGETGEWLETVWSNYFLRGEVVFDETGETGRRYFGQPATGLPFGRGFIVDRDGTVAIPYFGHDPRMAIDAIDILLGRKAPEEPRPIRRRLATSTP